MSVGLKRFTSVSSMSLRRLIWTPRPETSRPPAPGLAGDLVDFVDEDDAVFRELDVAVGGFDEVAHEIFDVGADVAGLGEFGGVCFYEGHADEARGVFHEVGFSDAGRAE